MGLDMYLVKKRYIGNGKIRLIDNQYSWIKLESDEYQNVRQIEIEEAYWRKANMIHKWFVDNVQDGNDDCGEYPVEINQIKELLEICKKIKKECIEDEKMIKNIELAEDLLPTQDGFFFGDTDYDNFYADDIINTIKQLEQVVKNYDEKIDDLYYRSSW